MAVTSVQETFPERSQASETNGLRTPMTECDRRFLVTFNTISGTEALAVTASDGSTTIPALYAVHPTDSTMRVGSVRAAPLSGTQYVWEVTVHYSTLVPTARDPSPLLMTPIVSYDSITVPLARTFAYNTAGSVVGLYNSANDPFDPPLTIDSIIAVVRIVRNEGSFNGQRVLTYTGALNRGVYFGFPTGYVRCARMNAEYVESTNRTYYRVTYEFHVNTHGWQFDILDLGSREYVTSNNVTRKQIIYDKGTLNPSGVVPLDGAGHRLPDSGIPMYIPGGPFFDTPPVDFTPLSLDPPTVPYG